MIELWKDIIEFDGYQISNLGRVKRLEKTITMENSIIDGPFQKTLQEKIYTPKGNKLYYSFLFRKNNKKYYKSIHRLVAESFIPNPKNKREVNHIDGNKHNNHLLNLEWVTRSENALHSFENNLTKPRGQSISEDLQNKIISYYGKLSQRKIASKLNTTFSIVNTCIKNYKLCSLN